MPTFEAVAGRVKHKRLPKIIGNNHVRSATIEPSIGKFTDYLSYDVITNLISYYPQENDGYELRHYSGQSLIHLKIIDK